MKGILFTEPMFRAVVAETKTQTRRLLNPQPDPEWFKMEMNDYPAHQVRCTEKEAEWYFLRSPRTGRACFSKDAPKIYDNSGSRYKPGEIVYLKEPYHYEGDFDDKPIVVYKFNNDIAGGRTWKNKLFMPAKYARYFIRIKGVKVERLQDISHEDCIAEGIKNMVVIDQEFDVPVQGYQNYLGNHYFVTGDNELSPAQRSYKSLWIKINGKDSWDKNPWVFAYTFELTEKPTINS